MASWIDVTADTYWTPVLGFGVWTGSAWSAVDSYVTLRRTGTWTAGYAFTSIRFSVSVPGTWELDTASVTYEVQVFNPALPDTEYALTLSSAFLEFQVVGVGSFNVTKIELYGDEIPSVVNFSATLASTLGFPTVSTWADAVVVWVSGGVSWFESVSYPYLSIICQRMGLTNKLISLYPTLRIEGKSARTKVVSKSAAMKISVYTPGARDAHYTHKKG